MGFVSKVFKSIFNPTVAKVPEVTTSARDLVSETSSQEVNSPEMGSSKTKKKNRGIRSLMINKDSQGSNSNTGINL